MSKSLGSQLILENTQIWKRENNNLKVSYLIDKLKFKILKIIGPCSLQSKDQLVAILSLISKKTDIVRAPIFKPRTNRFDSATGKEIFTGVGIENGKKIYNSMMRSFPDAKIAIEVMSPKHLFEISEYITLAWIGSRTQDQYLLQSIGDAATKTQTPIMVKNAMIPHMEFNIGRLNNVVYGIRLASHILKPSSLTPDAIYELLIAAFNQEGTCPPDGFMIEVYDKLYPSITDPGIETLALLKILNKLEKESIYEK